MNRIIYAGRDSALTYSKNFEIIVLHKKITVIPPLAKCNIKSGAGIRITLEQAILPFREITELSDDKNSGLLHAAEQAIYYFNAEGDNRLILSALGELIVSYLSAFSSKREYSPVVQSVIAKINANLSNCSFSLQDCLKNFPLNYDYTRKLFKKETGATPREYLLSERMKLAQSLLLGGFSNQYSEYTISQIAEACGFSNPLYFSRVFKSYFKMPPNEYKTGDMPQ